MHEIYTDFGRLASALTVCDARLVAILKDFLRSLAKGVKKKKKTKQDQNMLLVASKFREHIEFYLQVSEQVSESSNFILKFYGFSTKRDASIEIFDKAQKGAIHIEEIGAFNAFPL